MIESEYSVISFDNVNATDINGTILHLTETEIDIKIS